MNVKSLASSLVKKNVIRVDRSKEAVAGIGDVEYCLEKRYPHGRCTCPTARGRRLFVRASTWDYCQCNRHQDFLHLGQQYLLDLHRDSEITATCLVLNG